MAKTARIELRLTIDEKATLELEASQSKQTVSEYIRSKVVAPPNATWAGVTFTARGDGAPVGAWASHKCPDSRCNKWFGSENAKCPIHGRKAIPA